jgi:hypothetical protein
MSAINVGVLRLLIGATKWTVFEKYYVGSDRQNGGDGATMSIPEDDQPHSDNRRRGAEE